jgi:GMP synthase-like glutamine amidotransferase/diadenosine tetraphosphate (Ap4A) HIT family hydrolase
LNICILQNVPFEGAGIILPYFEQREGEDEQRQVHHIEIVHLYREYQLPNPEEVDLLVIMGGPMSVHDEQKHPYLAEVKPFIRQVIDEGKWVLGICLGAQLVAEALGAEVEPNPEKEIGWFPVTQTDQDSWLADLLPCEFTCLHWHGDTFDIPQGATHVARSEACEHQAFVWNNRVIGLQFHLEFTPQSTKNLIERSQHELVDAPWIQSESDMLADHERFEQANRLMAGVLRHIESEIEFELHSQLAEDCHLLGDLPCSRVLLHKNALIPWFILVPRGEYRDLDDMPPQRRNRLLAESDKFAQLLREEFGATKINIGALGNMVPQLHLHVIGRHVEDPCWPNPVWGNLKESAEWAEAEVERLRSLILI